MPAGFEYLCPVAGTLRSVDRHRAYCDHCEKHVYDLSSMTRQGAIGALAADEIPCVRLRVRRGRVRFRPDPDAGRSLARIARVGALAGALAGCASHGPDLRPAEQVICAAAQRLDGLVAEAEAEAEALAAEAAARAAALDGSRSTVGDEVAAGEAADEAAAAKRVAEDMAGARRDADGMCTRALARASARERRARSLEEPPRRRGDYILGGVPGPLD